jgi:hypothetical protein
VCSIHECTDTTPYLRRCREPWLNYCNVARAPLQTTHDLGKVMFAKDASVYMHALKHVLWR